VLGHEDCQVVNSRSTGRDSKTPTAKTVQMIMWNGQLPLTGGLQKLTTSNGVSKEKLLQTECPTDAQRTVSKSVN